MTLFIPTLRKFPEVLHAEKLGQIKTNFNLKLTCNNFPTQNILFGFGKYVWLIKRICIYDIFCEKYL